MFVPNILILLNSLCRMSKNVVINITVHFCQQLLNKQINPVQVGLCSNGLFHWFLWCSRLFICIGLVVCILSWWRVAAAIEVNNNEKIRKMSHWILLHAEFPKFILIQTEYIWQHFHNDIQFCSLYCPVLH